MTTLLDRRLPNTVFRKSVKIPTLTMLKPGKNNAKLGGEVTVKKWQGSKIYSLTLEERASCPVTCDQWDNCYGNNMPFAHRFDHEHPAFLTLLEDNVRNVCRKHPAGVVIRLHVLGDFYSPEYVTFWRRQLMVHPNLRIFGYTHHEPHSPIGTELSLTQILYRDRMAIRFSDRPGLQFSAQTVAKGSDPTAYNGIICPEQLGKTESCGTCGLCWTATDKPILFLEH